MVPHCWKPRKRRASAAFLLAFALPLLGGPASAQSPASGTIHAKQAVFRIPWVPDGDERQLQEVRLFVSEDQGQTWKKYSSVAPSQRDFNFRAERDGSYWFAVQSVNLAGNATPQNVPGTQPPLKMQVDTHPPVITLRSRPAREGMVAVEWDIRDDNLDTSSFTLEYRLSNSAEWIPLIADPSVMGERSWPPGTNGAVEVRLRVRDLARNEGEARLTLMPGGQESHTVSSAGDYAAPRGAGDAGPEKSWVKSKHISLNYEIAKKGPSGVSSVELWWTRDGREWKKYKEETDPKPPFVFDVYDEGIYGFTLAVKNGVGLGEPPPRLGDAPQIWVEVDLTKPIVHFVKTEIGRALTRGL